MRRRAPILFIAIAFLAAIGSCSDSKSDTDASSNASSSSTSTAEPTTTTMPLVGIDADAGIGDDLFPGLGNAGYDVHHYELDITVDAESPRIVNVTEIEARATDDLASFTLDLHGLRVGRVSVDGDRARFERMRDELRVTPARAIPSGADFVVVVRSRGVPDPMEDPALPFGLGWNRTPSGTYTLNEPGAARAWFPSNDHPSDKATYGITIHAHIDTDVVANGDLVSDESEGLRHTVRYEMTEPMATYLVQVATGDFTFTDPITTASGVTVQHVVDADAAARLTPLIAKVPSMIEFFEERFGPYPFDRYGVLVTRAAPGLALETQTLSIYDVSDLAPEAPSDDASDDFLTSLFLAHELAHQWFGDSVSPARWKDVWLNEGFASYAQYLWLETETPGILDAYMPQAYAEIAAPRAEQGIPADPTVEGLFGASVYDGAAVVLHVLRLEIGDDAFFELLREWVARFGGTSVTTDDFIELASEVSGRDLDPFLRAWLYDAIAPPYPDDSTS
jgi:aminopeptidase N